ncbi:MAG: helix-turn-helix transcriptional regulator [Lachnospiraceae bacterium]|nr:helix-turn-helix transcriptional regulator [Lachnospiraceae bacterium]
MFYDAELSFVQSYLKYSHIQCFLVTEDFESIEQIDFGLRKMIGLQFEYEKLLSFVKGNVAPNRIYRIVDSFFCNYFIFSLPDTPKPTAMVIGPFMMQNPLKTSLLELGEKFSIPPQVFPAFESYFSTVPVLQDDGALLTLLHTFGERIWGDANKFSLEIFERGLEEHYTPTTLTPTFDELDDTAFSMQALEERYAVERELMQAVSQGKTHKAEVLMNGMSTETMEQRTPDSLRNIKNYTIIMNTLMRKAAEQGAVHPYHIDKLSSDFARKIELITSVESCSKLQKEIVRKYCLLVKNHSMKGYSLLIQKVITQVDSDLTADLSLNSLANDMGVNPSYLSSQFKKETGSTLTDYVNRKKMEHAILLLNTTPLQIQTIALHCGIPDVNYFTKLFKKYIHKTPKEYRDSITAMHL